ncbi:hypothetical protein SUGI_1008670 [Cryptomeria japonica]|uniref:two-component response regulator ORR3 n=1 Tax=Cryptomeria japonica TaxID=3369 RepID=UPI00241497D3|nr:two-component response regulator ORR3 [Cryptomeria japonica]GLJ47755.1 hypothetical protein SUGI_1008670 [Cryptomeria japonica]
MAAKMRGDGNDEKEEAVYGDSVTSAEVESCEAHHVLAVDDCVIDRMVIKRLLRTDSVKVTAVESAAKALEVLGVNEAQHPGVSNNETYKYSMIITDYCMPGMTGYDLLKKLKEIKGLKDIPVVMMSSENVPHRIQRCMEEGAKDFIIKPVQLQDIQKLINHIKVEQPVSSTSSASAAIVSACKRKRNKVVPQDSESRVRPRIGGVAVA